MRFVLPEVDISNEEALTNRLGVATTICKMFIDQVDSYYKVSSEWEVVDFDGGLKLSYEPKGIRSAASPEFLVNHVSKMWLKARDKWPQVFTSEGYVALQMSVGTVSLNNDDFAKVFKSRVAAEEKA